MQTFIFNRLYYYRRSRLSHFIEKSFGWKSFVFADKPHARATASKASWVVQGERTWLAGVGRA